MAADGVTRRNVLRGAAGLTVAAAARPALAQSEPNYGGWFDNVGNYDGTVDKREQDEVTIQVGAQGNGGPYAFGPPAVRVSPGTTVVWEWTGKGGSHNVVAESGDFESDLTGETGYTFDYTFEDAGVYKYACTPHKTMGMKGAIVVGDATGSASGESSAETAGEGGSEAEPNYDGWFDNVGNYDSTVDETGSDEVTITVGADGNGGPYAFDPPAVRVSPGTTVTWEWTGSGGSHNVVAENGAFESELVGDAGHTFEYTFEEGGVYKYACTPHKSMGMKGAVVVPEASGGDGTGDGEAASSGGPDVSPAAGAVGVSLLLAFLSPLGLAAFLRGRQSDQRVAATAPGDD